ncbi:L-fucose mutarotase [Raoultella terrigena]|uniref:L-fucose mutarotase n=1 Tax=Raoultella terrigena TaxID=577 RepID=A0A3P8M0I2_RAOTE|nr:L-fucose mutarotase [Raoultella terrigena]
MGPQVIRADGLQVSDLLQAIAPLFELDGYAPPLVMMAAVAGDALDPGVEQRYRDALSRQSPCRKSSASIALRSTSGRKKPLRSLSQGSARSTGIFF